MLSKAQEKLIRSLHTKKGRRESGLLLLEGEKAIAEAGKHVEFRFTRKDTAIFDELVTTETPQSVAAVGRAPQWNQKELLKRDVIIVLDHVQDPGNVGTILRSAHAFGACVVLVESADPTSPKVVRAAAGAIFLTPWMEFTINGLTPFLAHAKRNLYRLENRPGAVPLTRLKKEPCVIVAGSEGQGLTLPLDAPSLVIEHATSLESLNVAIAVSLVLYELAN